MSRIIPAYTYHTLLAQRLLEEAPTSSDLVIFNPSNGPYPDDYSERFNVLYCVKDMGTLRSYGYVHLDKGNRPWRAVYRDCRDWVKYYGVNNFFFDDCPPDLGRGEYGALKVSSVRMVLNCGVPWVGTPNIGPDTVIVTRENRYDAPAPPQNARIPKAQQAAICYDTSVSPTMLIDAGFGYAYTTQDSTPNPYDTTGNK